MKALLSSNNNIFQNNFFFFNPNNILYPFYLWNIPNYNNQMNFLNYYFSKQLFSPILLQNSKTNSNEIKQTNSINEDNITIKNNSLEMQNGQEKKTFFKVNYIQNNSLFTTMENNFALEKEEVNLLQKKRLSNKRQRKNHNDNIRKKIKRRFLNFALINNLNDKLKSIGSKQYFEKFPQIFVCDIDQRRNKIILDLTLKEIFEKEDLYKEDKEKGRANFRHNLKIVQSEEIIENEEFQKYLNKTFRELYEEYVNSDEFKIGEINYLKTKQMTDEYIEKYINLSKSLIDFFNK